MFIISYLILERRNINKAIFILIPGTIFIKKKKAFLFSFFIYLYITAILGLIVWHKRGGVLYFYGFAHLFYTHPWNPSFGELFEPYELVYALIISEDLFFASQAILQKKLDKGGIFKK